MKILLARHGQTYYNQEGRLQGRADSPLTAEGEQFAELLSDYAQKMGVTAIYSSPMPRCITTIMPTANSLGISHIVDDRLLEVCYGRYEGMKKESLANDTHYAQKETNKYHYRHPGSYNGVSGESYANQYARVADFLQHLQATHEPQETILVVGHLGVCRNSKRFIEDATPEVAAAFSPHNNEIYLVDLEKNSSEIITLHDTQS